MARAKRQRLEHGIYYRDLGQKRRVYDICYRDTSGRLRWESGIHDLKEARRTREARVYEARHGTSVAFDRKLRLASYAEEWLNHRDPARAQAGRKARLSPSTFENYSLNIKRYVIPRLGSRPLASITTRDIDALIRSLEGEGKAPGTVRNILVPLRKMYGDAMRQHLVRENPCASADLPPAQDFAGKELSAEETDAIRAALLDLATTDKLTGERDLFYVYLYDVALGTGLRLGELRALRWRDFDRERRLIRIERAYARQHLKTPKSESGKRSVPAFAGVEAALEAMSARALVRGRYAPDELIFATSRGTPFGESNFRRRVWDVALRRAVLADQDEAGRWRPRYRFHDLRHTCVSRLVGRGADVKLVQAVAGHSNPVITLKRYSHLTDARITEAATLYDPARQHDREAENVS